MTEPRSFRVEAVVLRHADWGEADRLLTLYTRERGKVRAIAKGARKIRSRKAGHLEPFTRVTLQLARGHDLLIVTQADTVDAYLPIHENLVKTSQAAYIVELLDRFTYEDDTENHGIFRLLTEALSRLAKESDPWLAIRYYEVRLLELLGYRPHLFECANCGREIEAEDQFFSAALGGVLCPTCGASPSTVLRTSPSTFASTSLRHERSGERSAQRLRASPSTALRASLPGAWSVTVEALKYLRHFQRSDYAGAQRARPAAEVQGEVETLLQRYITYLLERALNSPDFIKQIKR